MTHAIQELSAIRDRFIERVRHSHETETKNKFVAFFGIRTKSRLAENARAVEP